FSRTLTSSKVGCPVTGVVTVVTASVKIADVWPAFNDGIIVGVAGLPTVIACALIVAFRVSAPVCAVNSVGVLEKEENVGNVTPRLDV
ncbi:hypothetical protein, partial [Escherichia coli]|uniref:hypothetical protein n=1 Tax=Escherichia coli TaxID=562 RepID=UPI001BFC656D